MADASFDGIVVGGGQHGLVISNYLALNGMTVAIIEKAQELGGPACSRSSPLPGFIANPHAEYLGFWNMPCNQDFRLHEKGLEFIFPDVQVAMAYPDGRCLVIYTAMEVSNLRPSVCKLYGYCAETCRHVPLITLVPPLTMCPVSYPDTTCR